MSILESFDLMQAAALHSCSQLGHGVCTWITRARTCALTLTLLGTTGSTGAAEMALPAPQGSSGWMRTKGQPGLGREEQKWC